MILLIAILLMSACATQNASTGSPNQPPVSSPGSGEPGDSQPPTGLPAMPAGQNPYEAKPGDAQLLHQEVYLDASQLLTREIFPPQVVLTLRGNLPTPCNQLRVMISAPDNENRILVDVYSVVDANKVCAQMLAPFEADVQLGGFTSGHYTVWVNSEQIGEFDS